MPGSLDQPRSRDASDANWRSERSLRLVPPAVTPLSAADIAAGVTAHLRGEGRTEFVAAIRDFLGGRDAATYTSFRRALAACLSEIDRATPGGREAVLVPAFCSSDFPAAIEGVGLEVRRYDVDDETLAMDLDSVADADPEDACALVAVNVLGYGSPMDRVVDRCETHDLRLVEALGYALGTTYDGRRLGTFGDCAVLNFQQGKPIPVGGGMVVSQSPDLPFSDRGRPAVDQNLPVLAGYAAFSRPWLYGPYTRASDLVAAHVDLDDRVTTHPGSKLDASYEPPFETMSNAQGTVGHRVFDRLDRQRRFRARTASAYADALADVPGVRHLRPVSGLDDHQYVRYPVLLATPELRDAAQSALRRTGLQSTTLYDWPVLDADRFPGAARLQRAILTLPTHPYVDAADRRRLVETVRTVCENSA